MAYVLKRQASGAFALHDRETRETMHPGRGPWEEANLLYVRGAGLEVALSRAGGELVLFDVGLGAAANALAAIACHDALRLRGRALRPLRLVSFEIDLAPLRFALAHAAQLGYLLGHEQRLEALAAQGRWEGGGVAWELRLGEFARLIEEEPRRADVVFFDPFSPRANPGLWRLATLESLFRCRRPGGQMRLLTYSTAFSTRCALLLAGFYVGEAPMPAAAAAGTEACSDFSGLARPLQSRWLQRWRRDRDPWPRLTPPGDRPRLRRALLEHPQWGHFVPAGVPEGGGAGGGPAGGIPAGGSITKDTAAGERRGKPRGPRGAGKPIRPRTKPGRRRGNGFATTDKRQAKHAGYARHS